MKPEYVRLCKHEPLPEDPVDDEQRLRAFMDEHKAIAEALGGHMVPDGTLAQAVSLTTTDGPACCAGCAPCWGTWASRSRRRPCGSGDRTAGA